MRTVPIFLCVTLVSMAISFFSCNPKSEHINDPDAGMNGSFEITQNGIPVNWLVYTPHTVPRGKFKIVLDDRDFQHGEQSLRFDIEKCSSRGGWRSPGFAMEFPAEHSSRYAVSFWVKNNGCVFTVSAGAIKPKKGMVKPLLSTENNIEEWRSYEYIISIPETYQSMRFEVNITRPGTFWIDNVKIEKI
jgi:hypothetical protein